MRCILLTLGLLVVLISGRVDGCVYISPLLRVGITTTLVGLLPLLPLVAVLGATVSTSFFLYRWVEERIWETKVARARVLKFE